MKKNKALFALLAGVVAAALFAAPATAMAETHTVTQADFKYGYYYADEGDTYELGENVTGTIWVMNHTSAAIASVIDLKGYTLTAPDNSDAISVRDTGKYDSVTIKNGTIVQNGSENAALRMDNPLATVTLSGVNATSNNHVCLDATKGHLLIEDGTYTTNNSGDSNQAVMFVSTGTITVNGGNFVLNGGSRIVERNAEETGNSVELSGGTFSDFPEQAELASSRYIHKTANGWVIGSGEAPADACWKLSKGEAFPTIYLDSTAEKDEFVNKYGADASDIEQLKATVTFDSDGGTPVESQKVEIGYCANIPEDPVKEGLAFDYWATSDGNPFNFYKPVTGDVALKAVYAEPVASYKGVNYPSLQDAIDESYIESAGGTVTLLKDTTESVKVTLTIDLTIDLGGHTLTSASAKASAITLDFPATLTITNGTVRAADDCLYVTQDAAGSTVNLASEGDLSEGPLYFSKTDSGDKEAGCVYVVGAENAPTTVNVMGGNYESAGTYAVRVEHTNLNVTDGQFSNGQDVDDSSTILASFASHVEFAGERVSGHIYLEKMSTATIHSGKFGDATNAGDVVAGKYLFKGDEDYYEVVDLDDALECASYVAYDYTAGTKVYFWKFEDAQAYADPLLADDHDVAIVRLYTVSFLAWKGDSFERYDVRTCEDGQEVGELPDSSEIKVDGYTFAGWYVDGQKIDSSYKVTKDVSAYAMWYKDGSEADPTDTPGDDQPSDSKGNKKLPQTGDATLAVSAVAAAGAALASLGALRRRK